MIMEKTDKSKLVLIIDDNEDDYRIISRFISNSYRMEYCGGQCDIVERITELNPDCILLDYHMELKEGIEILEDLKTREDLQEIPSNDL
jgi:CheY-like chemotaxis protein